jgi:hypothetical protein
VMGSMNNRRMSAPISVCVHAISWHDALLIAAPFSLTRTSPALAENVIRAGHAAW